MSKIKKILKSNLIKTLLVLGLIALPLSGSDCQQVLTGNTGSIEGKWKLVYNSGSNHDICPGEIVNFQTNGVANLQCPPYQQSINRNYSVSNGILTYTETGVEYRIDNVTNYDLQLSGLNGISRVLNYSKVSITDYPISSNPADSKNNSSESK
jgi:hypothetical protein